MQLKRIARNASQFWIGADNPAALALVRTPWTHCGTKVLLGWRSHQGDRQPQYADRLILMGVWHDPSQPGIEETGALSYCNQAWNGNPATDSRGCCLLA
jgi:hypothetical protein